MKHLKLLIIDDHKMIRDGIKAMLEVQSRNFRFEITEAESGEDAIRTIRKKDFDLILMDYRLPGINGAETAEKLIRQAPEVKILVVSNYDEYVYISSMIKKGVKGYVLKNISPAELLKAIKTILQGKKYFASEIYEKIVSTEENENSAALEVTRKTDQNIEKFGLTKREIEVLKLIAGGMTNEAISKSLQLSKRTIDKHRQNLLEKMEVKNTASLIKKTTELSIL